ncbi:MAG: MaoC family dehydratase [Acetobacteraceae bacterium]|nr:MaoC family dehydratase [Acetobacteraceae bacterium]
MPGLWLDEMFEGQVFDHPIRRTITEADNVLFCAMTMNPAAIHLDHAYAAGTEFRKPIVNSLLTLGLMIGISVHDTTLGTTVANLGMEDVTFPAPVFHGDTIRVRTTVRSVRPSKSRPGQGVVTFRHEAFVVKQAGQADVLVAGCKRAALMLARKP